jgi:hypothetical protein
MLSTRYSCQILIKFKFSRQIFGKKKAQVANFTKICPVVAELFLADKQTHERTHTKRLIVGFSILRTLLKLIYTDDIYDLWTCLYNNQVAESF